MIPTRILLVEDERIIALDVANSLRKLGYTVFGPASDAAAAVALAREARPDLVIMDIHLHGAIDGIEASRMIREELGIPSIFLTAYAEDETVERASVAAPLGYIVKPFDLTELHACIQQALTVPRAT